LTWARPIAHVAADLGIGAESLRGWVRHPQADAAGVDLHAPFGGVKASSFGTREQGRAARDCFTETPRSASRSERATGVDLLSWTPERLGRWARQEGCVHAIESSAVFAGVPAAGRRAGALKRQSIPQIADELGVSPQSLRNWVKHAALDSGERRDGLTSDEREELRRLRRENRRLTQEREILWAAAAFSAQRTDRRNVHRNGSGPSRSGGDAARRRRSVISLGLGWSGPGG
jgi:transposase